ncbi:hypothetical protein BI308_25575 [Roseofilum reptotaenium AO1-A]|uniref:Uncharacterized protein n=1 Tax=Roseofilum reptotaenium AO1-A TaxID=1925591 RepID=A0A1L9QFS9_9CYAN|nr:hypothetical protein BI308_25575 [Roseofilum reptotaenium AO1-A]
MQFIPATGGDPTLTSSTMEGAFFQLIEFIQAAESDTDINGSGVNRITGNINTDRMTYRGRYDINVSSAVDEDGAPILNASDYLTIPTWSPGDGSGTLKAATWSGQLLEILQYLTDGERNTPNPDGIIRFNPIYDFREGKITGDFNDIPLERTKTATGWDYTAKEIFN